MISVWRHDPSKVARQPRSGVCRLMAAIAFGFASLLAGCSASTHAAGRGYGVGAVPLDSLRSMP